MTINLKWNVPKQAQLWVKWSKIDIKNDNIIKLVRSEMYGPVFSDCLQLEESGHIFLDLTKHFIVLIPKPYIVKLCWKGLIEQDKERAIFKEMWLEDSLGHLQMLTKTDKILLDCSKHTVENESKGKYLSSYQSLIYRDSGIPYEFF